MYLGYRCYSKEDKPLGWLYTFSCDTECAFIHKNLHWCKRWKTERGAKKYFDRYNRRWQFQSKGGYLKIEVMPDIAEPKSRKSRYQKILEEWGDDVVAQPQKPDDTKYPTMSFNPKPELLKWLEDERETDDNGELESDAALLNRKLKKLKQLETQGF
ncbi:hypothetical protein [Nodularia chucula]|uniref:hypothetical protein n=1 Tax=Nodularia chucula TaxID=3093667 RepID=UPI0039C61304